MTCRALVVLLTLTGGLFVDPTVANAGRCAAQSPERNAYFGDLHVHTGISMDANMFGTALRPDAAYRFARGETLSQPPLRPGMKATEVRLDRPLDFAAVTDHASNFGSVKLCTTPGSASYDAEGCKLYRAPIDLSAPNVNLRQVIRQLSERLGTQLVSTKVCGEGGEICEAAAKEVWVETQQAAAAHNDATEACSFTTFVAYEYTATPELTKIHRNVIFRGDEVIDLPISFADEPEATTLWKRLRAECQQAGTGCDVLAIPHNSNLSNGRMFTPDYGAARSVDEQAQVAELRASLEPIVEVMQMKGDSECRNGMWNVLGATDELCGFEKIRPAATPDCQDGTGKGALAGDGCVSRLDFARYALVEGLREEARLGVNPYKFGMIAATDGHDGLPGPTEEHRLDLRMGRPNPQPGMNLGGLAGVWAEENSREALFDAMRRRETFGTSGPRMSMRLFGGWDYPDTLCSDADLVKRGYAGGVPMGGDLSAPPNGAKAPTFVLSALRDPGTETHPGGLLQRAQIIKGWADDEGKFHQQVIDVAGGANDAGVDPSTCAPKGPGHESLCAVWRDPDFDASRRAVYYARVVENPSCRTPGWACAAAPEDEKPPFCGAGPDLTTQERAWTSPIWFTPSAADDG